MKTIAVDLKVLPNSQGIYDLVINNGSLEYDYSWKTHITTALFEDARLPQQLAVNVIPKFRGGSPAEIILNYDGFKRGSLLWTVIKKNVVNNSTLSELKTLSTKALEWMINAKYVKSVSTTAVSNTARSANIDITLVNTNGEIMRETFKNISFE